MRTKQEGAFYEGPSSSNTDKENHSELPPGDNERSRAKSTGVDVDVHVDEREGCDPTRPMMNEAVSSNHGGWAEASASETRRRSNVTRGGSLQLSPGSAAVGCSGGGGRRGGGGAAERLALYPELEATRLRELQEMRARMDQLQTLIDGDLPQDSETVWDKALHITGLEQGLHHLSTSAHHISTWPHAAARLLPRPWARGPPGEADVRDVEVGAVRGGASPVAQESGKTSFCVSAEGVAPSEEIDEWAGLLCTKPSTTGPHRVNKEMARSKLDGVDGPSGRAPLAGDTQEMRRCSDDEDVHSVAKWWGTISVPSDVAAAKIYPSFSNRSGRLDNVVTPSAAESARGLSRRLSNVDSPFKSASANGFDTERNLGSSATEIQDRPMKLDLLAKPSVRYRKTINTTDASGWPCSVFAQQYAVLVTDPLLDLEGYGAKSPRAGGPDHAVHI
eukprot:gene17216-23539_t